MACAGPVLGFGGSLLAMQHSFTRIGKLNAPTPGQLAEGVYESMSYTAIGFGFGAAGVLLLLLALWRLACLRAQLHERSFAQESWR